MPHRSILRSINPGKMAETDRDSRRGSVTKARWPIRQRVHGCIGIYNEYQCPSISSLLRGWFSVSRQRPVLLKGVQKAFMPCLISTNVIPLVWTEGRQQRRPPFNSFCPLSQAPAGVPALHWILNCSLHPRFWPIFCMSFMEYWHCIWLFKILCIIH